MTAPHGFVPRRFPNETIVCLGSGPSLTQADVDAVRGRARVIAINKSYELAVWADVMYAADAKFWNWEHGAPAFTGPKYATHRDDGQDPVTWPDVQVLQNTGPLGLELAPTGVRTGFHSGYQAVNVAVHLGASRILLLGYDHMEASDGQTHWHPPHPDRQPSPFAAFLSAWPSMVEPLHDLGIEVVNCSRRTALTTFPCLPLNEALARAAVAA